MLKLYDFLEKHQQTLETQQLTKGQNGDNSVMQKVYYGRIMYETNEYHLSTLYSRWVHGIMQLCFVNSSGNPLSFLLFNV